MGKFPQLLEFHGLQNYESKRNKKGFLALIFEIAC